MRVGFLFLSAESLAELLELVAALDGGFGGFVVAAAGGDGDGDFFPLVGLELTALEEVPFFLVGLDEIDCLWVGPRQGLGFLWRRDGLEWFWGLWV